MNSVSSQFAQQYDMFVTADRRGGAEGNLDPPDAGADDGPPSTMQSYEGQNTHVLQIDVVGPKAFRTRQTLVRTMDHLRGIMDRTDAPFSLIHNFLFDRYRSVRQDLYVQGIEVIV